MMMTSLRSVTVLLVLLVGAALAQKVDKDGMDVDDYNVEAGRAKMAAKRAAMDGNIQYTVTEEVFFDIEVTPFQDTSAKPYKGRIVIAVFGDIVPITALNFVSLARGFYQGRSALTYKKTIVHKITKDFVLQMGDVSGRGGKSGTSIYGSTFRDENFILSNRGAGWVSMANYGSNTNGSQFFILLQPARWLDGRHVVFGKVIKGMKFIQRLGEEETYVTAKPKAMIQVVDCGVVGIMSKYQMAQADLDSQTDIA